MSCLCCKKCVLRSFYANVILCACSKILILVEEQADKHLNYVNIYLQMRMTEKSRHECFKIGDGLSFTFHLKSKLHIWVFYGSSGSFQRTITINGSLLSKILTHQSFG